MKGRDEIIEHEKGWGEHVDISPSLLSPSTTSTTNNNNNNDDDDDDDDVTMMRMATLDHFMSVFECVCRDHHHYTTFLSFSML